MIGTYDIKVNAAHPNLPLDPLYTFLGSAQQVRVINVPKAIGNWKITAVAVTVNYPDNTSPSVSATLVGGCWSATLPAPTEPGKSLMGFKVTASGVDEHGDQVENYTLGKGDAYVLDDDATITVGGTTYYVHLLDSVPTTPHKSDMTVIDGVYKIYDGTQWRALGGQTTISWSDITGKPTAFPPEAHAASHAANGSDPLTPADIGAVATVPGKGLSSNDYTTAEKNKLAGIEAGAEVNPTPVAPSTEIAEGAFGDAKLIAEFVNSSINNLAAFYLTKDAQGNAFPTKAALDAATTFYNGGVARVPTKNDYLIVLADEEHTTALGVDPTTRYVYDGAQWAFQYVVNNNSLTQAQVNAINSGITAALVAWLAAFKGNDTATTLASVLAAIDGKLSKSGGTVTGSVIFQDEVICSDRLNIGELEVGNIEIGYLIKHQGSDILLPSGGGNLATLQDLGEYLRHGLEDYDNGSTYAVGEFVRYNGAIYCCKTAITTAEAWTPAHWTEMSNVADFFSESNTKLTARVNELVDDKIGDINDALDELNGEVA